MAKPKKNLPLAISRDPKSGVLISVREDDTGTAERARQGMGVVNGRHFILDDSKRISERTGARAVDENLFDRLVARGIVADPAPDDGETPTQEARREVALDRRIAAANWLAALYQKTGLAQSVSGKYQPFSTKCNEDSESISDAEAWNRRCFNDMWREIPRAYADMLCAIVCHQEVPRGATPTQLRAALDALADWRGF